MFKIQCDFGQLSILTVYSSGMHKDIDKQSMALSLSRIEHRKNCELWSTDKKL